MTDRSGEQLSRLRQIVSVLRFILQELGALIVFWLLLWGFGIRIAIAGTIAFIVLDAVRRRWRHVPFTRIYLLSSGLAVIFGIIDLLAASPFMIKYEAVVTNLATGIAFAAGARGAMPLLQEIAEKREGKPYPERADIRRFFQYFTLAWAVYFFLKAGLYLWLGAILPLDRALALRSLIGGVSLAAMIAISTQGRHFFALCHRLGLLPVVIDQPK